MFGDYHILKTGKFPKLEHIFSSKKHKIFRAYESQSAETYLTKILVVQDQKIFNHYKHHIYHNILPRLQKIKYLRSTSLLGIDPSSVEIMVKTAEVQHQTNLQDEYNYEEPKGQKQQILVKEYRDTNTMFITKQFIRGLTLREMIINKDERLDGQFCLDLVGEIVDCLFMGGGVNDFFVTTENIIVEDSGLIYFNYFSFVGLQFCKYDKYIPRSQFEQILPYLTSGFINEVDPEKRAIDIEMELKFIMVNFISAFLKRDFIFDNKYFELDFEVKRTDKKISEAIQKINRELMPTLLSKEQLNQLTTFNNQFKVRYIQILNRLNIKRAVEEKIKMGENDKRQQQKQKQDANFDLNWQEILLRLSPKQKLQQTEDERKFAEKTYQFKNYMSVKNNDKFHMFFPSVLLEVIDLYINIIKLLSEKQQNLKVSQLRERADTLFKQRQQLIQKKRYTKSLYIPIKIGMRFTQILKYQNWVHMLLKAKQTNEWTLNSIFVLFRFIQTMKEDIYKQQAFISSQLLEKALRTRKYTDQWKKNQQNPFSQTVYALFLKKQTQLQYAQNIKQIFWCTFYQVTNKMQLLLKKYYLRVTEHNISNNIKVNRNDFWPILIRMKFVVPDMPSKKLKCQKNQKREQLKMDKDLQNSDNLNNVG